MTLDEAINKNIKMAELQERLLSNVDDSLKEIVMKFAAEYRQLAAWLTELKEAKRLLKAAIEDNKRVLRENFGDICQFCKHYSNSEAQCCKPHNGSGSWCCENAEWRYADEALKLIGGADND